MFMRDNAERAVRRRAFVSVRRGSSRLRQLRRRRRPGRRIAPRATPRSALEVLGDGWRPRGSRPGGRRPPASRAAVASAPSMTSPCAATPDCCRSSMALVDPRRRRRATRIGLVAPRGRRHVGGKHQRERGRASGRRGATPRRRSACATHGVLANTRTCASAGVVQRRLRLPRETVTWETDRPVALRIAVDQVLAQPLGLAEGVRGDDDLVCVLFLGGARDRLDGSPLDDPAARLRCRPRRAPRRRAA